MDEMMVKMCIDKTMAFWEKAGAHPVIDVYASAPGELRISIYAPSDDDESEAEA